MERLSSIEELQRLQKDLLQERDPQRLRVRICMTGCRAFGAVEVRDAFRKSIEENGLAGKVDIVETGCHGFCARAPVAAIDPHGFFYQQISPKDVPADRPGESDRREARREASLQRSPNRATQSLWKRMFLFIGSR